MQSQFLDVAGAAAEVLSGDQQKQQKHVRFDDNVIVLPLDVGEPDYVDEDRWFSQNDIASFREDTLKTVQMQRVYEERGGEPLNEDEFCLRGLESRLLKRPPPNNFVRRVLRLQSKQRQQQQQRQRQKQQRKNSNNNNNNNNNNSNTKIIKNKGGDNASLATSLQLFSEACSKYARKRAVQLAAEDEFDAYQIFMSGLRKTQRQQYDHDGDDLDDDDDDDDDYDFDDMEDDFDFCTESDFVNDIYDYGKYKNDPTEDETEYDDSDGVYDTVVAVDKDGKPLFVEDDPFAMEDEDDIFATTPVC